VSSPVTTREARQSSPIRNAIALDPYHLEEDSTREEFGEERSRAIGMMGSKIVTVIDTDRPERRRIISARRARKDERARYDQSKTTA